MLYRLDENVGTSRLNEIRCRIVGKAEGPLQEIAGPHGCITFNGSASLPAATWRLDASCRRIPFSKNSQIELTGEAPDEITELLRSTLVETTQNGLQDLECWPSTGFSIVHAMWNANCDVTVDRIRFDPSLCRERSMGPRSAPAHAYHNWLGERRITLARWLRSPPRAWQWDLLPPAAAPPQEGGRSISLESVLEAFDRARHTRTLDALHSLLPFPIEPDPALLSRGRTATVSLTLEGLFHLDRGVHETKNWWLYDERGSQVAQNFAIRIRQAQDAVFIQASKHRATISATTPAG